MCLPKPFLVVNGFQYQTYNKGKPTSNYPPGDDVLKFTSLNTFTNQRGTTII